MADNTTLAALMGGAVNAADDLSGVLYPRVKIVWGVDGVANDANATTPLPVSLAAAAVNLGVIVQVPTALGTNVKTVTTAGTRVQLSAATISSITIKAHAGNAGTIYVGGSTVAAGTGFRLDPGESVSFDLSNASTVWLDAQTSGDGVSYLTVG